MSWKDIASYPPAVHALRIEKKRQRMNAVEKAVNAVIGIPIRAIKSKKSTYTRILPLVSAYAGELEGVSDARLRLTARELGLQMRRHGFTDQLVAKTFAVIRETAGRTLGMKHFDCQLIGGNVLLRGLVAEMDTGEGKTLTATLAAGAAALAGIPVHVISVNDYLTSRDAEKMGPVYRALGLSVGCIVHDMEPAQRRKEYLSDVTYCTNKELVFDYLRDLILLGDRQEPVKLQAEYLFNERKRSREIVLRGLHYGIVDEADSILIDEARTPLIIAQKVDAEDEAQFMEQALNLARALAIGKDYTVDTVKRFIELTPQGRSSLADRTRELGPLWTGTVRREETVQQALSAIHLFKLDEHYIVRENKVEIVDEFTGRSMPDRSWERGLHQLIELKEGCEVTQRQETQARISYQNFFRKYLHLAGMTGTAKEVTGELWSVYGLSVVNIPPNRPSRREHYPDKIFANEDAKWREVVKRIKTLNDGGRPVLVGTRTISASAHLSHLLKEANLEHQVLNARYEKEEADIVAKAGEYGKITIATNMAGRGTDIMLGTGVAEMRGLHIIMTEYHEAKRIDRQFIGRCGRQGDPGSYEAILSLDDPLIAIGGSRSIANVIRPMLFSNEKMGSKLGIYAIRLAQKRVERMHARIRRELMIADEKRNQALSFSGKSD